MSLVKRLWMVITLIAVCAVGSATVINVVYAKRYLENELKVKNFDAATALATSISQTATDLVTTQLLVSTQFDLGHYQQIDYFGPDGKLIDHRESQPRSVIVPQWFIHLVQITPQAGVAQIQAGWKQLGAIHIMSDASFAYESLWKSALTLFQLFVAGGLLLGVVGTFFIRSVVRPLNQVVDQARALADRRYVEIAPPATLEFRLIVESMNRFAQKIKNLFDDESARLRNLQQNYEYDKLTGYMVRPVFLRNVEAEIEQDDTAVTGALLMVRIDNLAELNRELGRLQTDQLFQILARKLQAGLATKARVLFGRLNSTDLCALIPGEISQPALRQMLQKSTESEGQNGLLRLSFGIARYFAQSNTAELLSICDQRLALLESIDANDEDSIPIALNSTADEWAGILDQALNKQELKLGLFPVRGRNQLYLHSEAPARIVSAVAGREIMAGEFLPWARKRGMAGKVDLEVVRVALDTLIGNTHILAINLGFESVCDDQQVLRIVSLLQLNQHLSTRIYIDIAEEIAFAYPEKIRQFCTLILAVGCRVGIEHLNHHLGHIGQVHNLGLHYIKVSRALVKDIGKDYSVQTLLRSLCTIAHAIGLDVIAEGVMQVDDADLLFELGFDGLTGPGVH